MKYFFVFLLALGMIIPSGLRAESSTDLSTPIFEQESRAPLTWLRFRRWLSGSEATDARLTLSLTNRLAEQMDEKTTRRDELSEEYASERDRLAELVDSLLAGDGDDQINQLIETVLSDETVQAIYLADLTAEESGELAGKILEVRQETLRDIAEVLADPGLSQTDRQAKIGKLTDKYAEREQDIANKVVEKLTYKDDLDDATEDVELEDALGLEEDDILDDAAAELSDDELADFIDEISREEGDQAIVVLQKLLARVPESARSGIETAIDAVIQEQMAVFRADPSQMQNFLADYSGSDTVREILLERMKEQAGSEELKQAIEQLKEETDRAEEARKQELERAREDQDDTEGDESEADEDGEDGEDEEDDATPSSSPSNTPTSSSTSASPSSTEQREETVEIKIGEDGTLEKSSFTVINGTSVTIRVDSEYETAVSMVVSGVGTKTITKDQRQTFGPFTITSTVSFTVNNQTGSISVQ